MRPQTGSFGTVPSLCMDLSEFLGNADHVRFVEWLSTPPTERRPATQEELALDMGYTGRTLRNWKNRPEIRAAWEEHSREVVGDPSNVQEVLEAMRKVGLDTTSPKQVAGAKVYLDAVGAIRPEKKAGVPRAKGLDEFTDDELLAAIASKWSEGQPAVELS